MNEHKHESTLFTTLRLLEILALVGLIYCVFVLMVFNSTMDASALILGGWFMTSAICLHLMRHNHRWGAYGLGIATLIVTVIDIINGQASLGGASVGVLILFVLLAYLYQTE